MSLPWRARLEAVTNMKIPCQLIIACIRYWGAHRIHFQTLVLVRSTILCLVIEHYSKWSPSLQQRSALPSIHKNVINTCRYVGTISIESSTNKSWFHMLWYSTSDSVAVLNFYVKKTSRWVPDMYQSDGA